MSATRRVSFSTAAYVLSVVLMVMAGNMLGQDVLDWDGGIDSTVQRAFAPQAAHASGLMSGAASLVFVLIGGALVLMQHQGRSRWLGLSFAVTAFLIWRLSLLACVFRADLLTLRGGQGWISEFFQDTRSAKAGRRYLVFLLRLHHGKGGGQSRRHHRDGHRLAAPIAQS